ncbi:hypothetical protein C6366_18720 [Desulfonatronum sp. SC1]|nr:hypothetical protein C6366_18720 [Desulfonatronum sp. SC1]
MNGIEQKKIGGMCVQKGLLLKVGFNRLTRDIASGKFIQKSNFVTPGFYRVAIGKMVMTCNG